MADSSTRVTVGVAVDPFLFRSALHAALVADGRFDAHLCPLGDDAVLHARGCQAQMLIVSRRRVADGLCVVVLSSDDPTVQISTDGRYRNLDYGDMSSLRNQLAQQGGLLTLRDAAS